MARFQSRINPGAFLQGGGGGGGDDKGDTAMAMALMGYGRGQSPEELGLSKEELAAKVAGQQSSQELEGRKFDAEQAFREWQKKEASDRAGEELKYKTAELANKAQTSQDSVNIEVYKNLPIGPAGDAMRQKLLRNMTPATRDMMLGVDEVQRSAGAASLLPLVKAAYAKGDVEEVKRLTKDIDPNILQRPEFEWGKWNQEMTPASQRGVSGGRGLLGLLWNTPGALQNVGKGIVNTLSSGLLGEGAPQQEYTKFSDPVKWKQAMEAQHPGLTGESKTEAPLAGLLDSLNQPDMSDMNPPADVFGGGSRLKVPPVPYAPGAGFSRQGFPPPVGQNTGQMLAAGYQPGGEFPRQQSVPETDPVNIDELLQLLHGQQRFGQYAPPESFSRQGLPQQQSAAVPPKTDIWSILGL